MLTPIQVLDHAEYAMRGAFVIVVGSALAFCIGYFVSDREVCDE